MGKMSWAGLEIPRQFWAAAAGARVCSFPGARPAASIAIGGALVVGAAAVAIFADEIVGFAAGGFVVALGAVIALPHIRRYRLLRTAVANMWQGVALYDRDGRLALYNPQFGVMLGLLPADLSRARTHRDVVALSVRAGNYGDLPVGEVCRDEEAFIARRRAALAYLDLPNARTIAESHEPIAAGGWVRTYADVTRRRQIEHRIIHMARHDPLTDLPNRVVFRDGLERALASAAGPKRVGLIYLDLDRFKPVNDTFGHAVGDKLLGEVADRLRTAVGDSGMVARLGGDEFGILLEGFEEDARAFELAGRVIAAISAPYQIGEERILIGVSLGVAFAPQRGATAEELLGNADTALYRAKACGGDVYRVFANEAASSAA